MSAGSAHLNHTTHPSSAGEAENCFPKRRDTHKLELSPLYVLCAAYQHWQDHAWHMQATWHRGTIKMFRKPTTW